MQIPETPLPKEKKTTEYMRLMMAASEARRREVVYLAKSGLNCGQIAEQMSLTRQRIGQILRRAGYLPKQGRPRRHLAALADAKEAQENQ